MDEKRFYTHEEVVSELIGAVGTPQRDKYEEDLGQLVGVQSPNIQNRGW